MWKLVKENDTGKWPDPGTDLHKDIDSSFNL